MAEAAVETSNPAHPSRFFCHICNVDFQNASADFTCPYCCNGFIEELEDNAASGNSLGEGSGLNNSENGANSSMSRVWDYDSDDSMDTSTNGAPENRSSRRYAQNRTRSRSLSRLSRSQPRHNVPFDTLIQDFIINLGVGATWGATGNIGNMQWFLGNPGDYAWGREGLDAIVTQLLNQMDSTGPPPVSKDVIDALPMVDVAQDQIDAKLQCSVCWEHFVAAEKVRQLPCTHIYHDPCIRPWLELHGTCPICRQNLIQTNTNNSQNNGNDGGAGSGNFFQPDLNDSNSSVDY